MAQTAPFRYLRDPLFLFCVALYALNRCVLKPHFPDGPLGAFLHGSLNDLICIPFWVPILVWLLRCVRLRREEGPPNGAEILVPLWFCSCLFELWLPRMGRFEHVAIGDPNDIVCYTMGALLAVSFWRVYYRRRSQSVP